MANHTIHKLVVDAAGEIADRNRGREAADMISLWVKEDLLPLLEQWFDTMIEADQHIRLDKLNLRLELPVLDEDGGFISSEQLLRSQLQRQLERTESDWKTELVEQFVGAEQHGSTGASSQFQHKSVESFVYYLRFGIMPWWESRKASELIQELRETWPRVETEVKAELSPLVIRYPKVLQRLAASLPLEWVAELKAGSITQVYTVYASFLVQKPLVFNRALEFWQGVFLLEKKESKLTILQHWLPEAVFLPKTYQAWPAEWQEALLEQVSQVCISRWKRWSVEQRQSFYKAYQDKSPALKIQELDDEGEFITKLDLTDFYRLQSALNLAIKVEQKAAEKIQVEQERAEWNELEKRIDDGLWVSNAGLVLLGPFLPQLFKKLKYLDDTGRSFLSEETQRDAIGVLGYLAGVGADVGEDELIVPKLLTAYSLTDVVTPRTLSKAAREEAEALIISVIGMWEKLGNSSMESIQQTFLQRAGMLRQQSSGWQLQVEPQTYDILINFVPWGFRTIRLPWMKELLFIEWDTPNF